MIIFSAKSFWSFRNNNFNVRSGHRSDQSLVGLGRLGQLDGQALELLDLVVDDLQPLVPDELSLALQKKFN